MVLDLNVEWRSMQRRIVAQLENDQLPELGDAVLDFSPSIYSDPLRFERERSEVFRRLPLVAGLSDELAEPGDRISFDAAGIPVLIIRGDDRKLRAFLNICTHRGARLAHEDGNYRSIVCPYHGWAFNNDGSLKNIPVAEAFGGIDFAGKGLVSLPVAEWCGLIFVRVMPGGDEIDVEAHLGGLAPILAQLDLGKLKKNGQTLLQVPTNWKLALDTGREIYHVPVVHRNTLAKNLYPHTMIFDQYGPHNRYAGAGKDFAGLLGKPEEQWPKMGYQAVHYIYPNSSLSISHSIDGETPMVSLTRIFPGESVGESSTYMSTFSRGSEEQANIHEQVVSIVNTEDFPMANGIWKNFASQPEGLKLSWGRNEALLQQYHLQLAEDTGMPLES